MFIYLCHHSKKPIKNVLFVYYSYVGSMWLRISINDFLVFSLARKKCKIRLKIHMMQIILKFDWQDKEFEFQSPSQWKTTKMFDQQRKTYDKVWGWLAPLKINSTFNHSFKKYLLSVSDIPDKVLKGDSRAKYLKYLYSLFQIMKVKSILCILISLSKKECCSYFLKTLFRTGI